MELRLVHNFSHPLYSIIIFSTYFTSFKLDTLRRPTFLLRPCSQRALDALVSTALTVLVPNVKSGGLTRSVSDNHHKGAISSIVILLLERFHKLATSRILRASIALEGRTLQ